ncbi:uncharacterized protein LOC133924797 [Phragmites australis]|uniref:uncharacterized protein LOC133924797 n=1 Tax=Phragmites australis TaxID=29695 RepID=UPI002D79056D|nr:uncharacterized protein LOC133924797 [Phragmites australis]
MVSAALGFGTTAAFVAFVCAQFICCCTRREPLLSSSPSDFPVDLDRLIEHAHNGLEPLVIAAIPTVKYNCEAFHSKDDAQSMVAEADDLPDMPDLTEKAAGCHVICT